MSFAHFLGFDRAAGKTFPSSESGCEQGRRCQIKEAFMNWDQMEGKWKQYSGKLKEKWGKLTDDDLTVIHGKRDQLAGKIEERYGIAKEEAQKQVEEFNRFLDTQDTTGERNETIRESEVRAEERAKK